MAEISEEVASVKATWASRVRLGSAGVMHLVTTETVDNQQNQATNDQGHLVSTVAPPVWVCGCVRLLGLFVFVCVWGAGGIKHSPVVVVVVVVVVAWGRIRCFV